MTRRKLAERRILTDTGPADAWIGFPEPVESADWVCPAGVSGGAAAVEFRAPGGESMDALWNAAAGVRHHVDTTGRCEWPGHDLEHCGLPVWIVCIGRVSFDRRVEQVVDDAVMAHRTALAEAAGAVLDTSSASPTDTTLWSHNDDEPLPLPESMMSSSARSAPAATWSVDDGGVPSLLVVYAPTRLDDGSWVCTHGIEGPMRRQHRVATGEDSMESLFEAFEGLRVLVDARGCVKDAWPSNHAGLPVRLPTQFGRAFLRKLQSLVEAEHEAFVRQMDERRRQYLATKANAPPNQAPKGVPDPEE